MPPQDPRTTTTTNPYLAGNFAPVADEVTAFDLPVTGTIPRELAGSATCATDRTRSASRSRDATTGSSATAWCTASACATARPSGTATATCATTRSPAAGRPTIPGRSGTSSIGSGAANTNVIGARRHDASRWSRRATRPVELDLRARDRRPLRLRRHAAGRLHRAPEARPGHRRAARRRLLLAPWRPRAVRRRRHRRDGAPHRRRAGAAARR